MRLDLLPIFQTDEGLKPYLVTNFRRIVDLLSPINKQAAVADTTGASLAQLETEVNTLKARLRSYGVIET